MIELPYIKCEPCMNGRCWDCEGTDETKPVCGCRCYWLETLEGD